MESYEEEELSLQEKKELVTKFISYAPPGEVDDVTRGLKCIINKNSDIKQAIQEARLAYDQVVLWEFCQLVYNEALFVLLKI